MIQPVICEVFSNRESVRRLVQYCKDLDGTEIKVVSISPEEDAEFKPEYTQCANSKKSCRAAFSLHKSALAMAGQPFIWLEHDSVPLKSGWAKKLESEYKKRKKPFMLSSDTHPPHDLVGGIGIYGPDTHWMIPQHFRGNGWDLWMINNVPELISRTPFIQHSFGLYDKNGIATPHRFPRDNRILRDNAVIFHADKNHDLMRSRRTELATFYHSGDLGDIIYHLEVIRLLGGGSLILGSNLGLGPGLPSQCREPMTENRIALISELFTAQPYIKEVSLNRSDELNPEWINLNTFRETMRGGIKSESLYRAGLRRFGFQPQDETTPWLTVPNTDTFVKPIIVARSPRYHRDDFPWKEIVERYNDKIHFIGLISEFQAFVSEFGSVEYLPTATLLEAAQAIQKSSMFIGNQSSPYALAEGLKKPAVQETFVPEPNCIFERPNTLYRTSDWPTIKTFIERIIDSSPK